MVDLEALSIFSLFVFSLSLFIFFVLFSCFLFIHFLTNGVTSSTSSHVEVPAKTEPGE